MNTTPLMIARRLRPGKEGDSRRSATGIAVAVTGIALALVVMMVSIAVMQGFKSEIKRKVAGFESQIVIETPPPADMSATGDMNATLSPRPVGMTPTVTRAIGALGAAGYDVKARTASMRPVILKTTDNFKGLVAKGLSDTTGLEFLSANIVEGRLPAFGAPEADNSIVISRTTARELGLEAGSKTRAFFFDGSNVKVRNLDIAAVYDTRFSDYDKTMMFASLPLLARIDRLGDGNGTRIELNGLDDGDVDAASAMLQQLLLEDLYAGRDTVIYQVDNVHRTGAHYFNWLDLLDTNVTVILVLMAIVSGFTLISSLFIIILERVGMIGLLKSLGASNAFIRRIFILVARRIVVRGMVIGNVLALALIWIQATFSIVPLDPDTYFLASVPVKIGVAEVLWLNAGVFVFSIAILILPSQIVARISPSQTMRFE